MVDPNTPEIVTFNFDVDAKEAIKKIGKFQQALGKRVQDSEKAIKKMDKGFFKFIKQVKSVGPHTRGLTTMTQHMKELEGYVSKTVPKLQALADAASKGGDTEMAKDLQKQIKTLQDTHKEMNRGLDSIEKDSIDIKGLIEGAKEAGDELTAPLHELLSKDAPALIQRGAGLLGKALDKTTGKAFGKLQAWSAGKADKAKAEGKGASFTGFKGLEVVSKALANLGPVLTVATSFLGSFIKMLIDAEAAVKDYNKAILSNSGTAEMLYRNMNNSTAAIQDLEQALRSAREGATDFSNVTWGITKEMGSSFQAGLAQEGVSLGKLGDELRKTTGYAKGHAEAIQMSVAYSRSFGVSLSELTQLQGSMMSDMGMSLDRVQASFHDISISAQDAGVASNKFFSIVRSFSSDLSLFTLRMEDITKVMRALGKTMDPREAQKFLQTLTQKFTGGIGDNLKHAMIAGKGGEKTRQIGLKDVEGKRKSLIEDLTSALHEKASSGSVEDQKELDSRTANAVEEILRVSKSNDPQKIAQMRNKYEGKVLGTVWDAIDDMANQERQLAKKDALATASVMNAYSPLAKSLVTQEEIKNLTGKSLNELSGLDMAALEGASVATVKELRSFQKMDVGIRQGIEKLISEVESGNATTDTLAQLDRLGIKYDKQHLSKSKATVAAVLRGPEGQQKYMDSLTKDTRKALEDSAADIDYQKKTASFQTSLLDKMGIMSDIWLSKIYDVLTDIYDSILDLIPKFGNDFAKLEQVAARIHNTGITQAFTEHQGDRGEALKAAIEGPGKAMLEKVQAAVKEAASLNERLKTEKDEGAISAIQKRLAELKPATEMSTLRGAGDLYRLASMKDQEGNQIGFEEVLRALSNLNRATKDLNFTSAQLEPPTGTPKAAPPPPVPPTAVVDPMAKTMPDQLKNAVGPNPPSSTVSTPTYPTAPTVTPVPGTGAGQAGPTAKDTVKVELSVNQNLQRLVDVRVTNGVASFERNKRLR